MNNTPIICTVSEKCKNCTSKQDCLVYAMQESKSTTRENVGYKIIYSIKIKDFEIVLGHDATKKLSPYVTWIYCNNKYSIGHYHDSIATALFDFIERAKDEYDFYSKLCTKE